MFVEGWWVSSEGELLGVGGVGADGVEKALRPQAKGTVWERCGAPRWNWAVSCDGCWPRVNSCGLVAAANLRSIAEAEDGGGREFVKQL